MRDGPLSYRFDKVGTLKRGKPVNPREPENATGYYLRFTQDGKRKMLPAGDDFQAAQTALRHKEMQREYVKRSLDMPNTGGQQPANHR